MANTGDRNGDPPTRLTEPAVDPELSRRFDRWGTSLATRGEERDHALVRRFTLLVTAGADAGQRYVSTGERLTIGTHPSCDVVVHDGAVSRFHCEIALVGKAVVLRDLESSNGTLVDGVSIVQAYLRGGSVLTLGRTQIRFDTGGEPVRVPLSTRERFGTLVGSGAAMRRLFAHLERAAATEAPVLLEGEAGSGKTAAAESLHAESARRGGPFVVVDCSTLAPAEVEATLLGADGALVAAGGGTLLLREVGDVPLELQPQLAAAIETRRLPGDVAHDARVLGSTRRSLKVEVNSRRLRSDLYARLAVIECRLPPLRERPEDLPALVDELLLRAGAAGSPEAERLRTRDFYTELARHAWPGNVRELAELVERTLERTLGGHAAAPAASVDRPLRDIEPAWNDAFERRYLEGLLARHPGDPTAAARAAGLDRTRFDRLLLRHGLV